jgi:DNA-binding LytR/AlgR family response regulator
MNVLIVEDEAMAARRLSRMVKEIVGDSLKDITVKSSIVDAEVFLQHSPIDLVLLDLNLNGESGFQLLHQFTAGSFHTIIVSASLDQAITAFEHGVLDFVPKPYDLARLKKALDRVNEKIASNENKLKYLSVKNQGNVRLVPLENVRYFKGADDYVEIQLKDGSYELYSKSMDNLLTLLPKQYCRIHKSYIVDLSLAKRIHVHGGGKYELEMNDGILLPVSRTQYQLLQDRMI